MAISFIGKAIYDTVKKKSKKSNTGPLSTTGRPKKKKKNFPYTGPLPKAGKMGKKRKSK